MDQIHDIHGLRLIVEKEEDCYRALDIVHRVWPEVIGRFKDYITHPKFNGWVTDDNKLVSNLGILTWCYALLPGISQCTLLYWVKGCFLWRSKFEQKKCICRPNMVLLPIGGIKKETVGTPHLYFKWWNGRDGFWLGNARQWIMNSAERLGTQTWSGHHARFLLMPMTALIPTLSSVAMMDPFMS